MKLTRFKEEHHHLRQRRWRRLLPRSGLLLALPFLVLFTTFTPSLGPCGNSPTSCCFSRRPKHVCHILRRDPNSIQPAIQPSFQSKFSSNLLSLGICFLFWATASASAAQALRLKLLLLLAMGLFHFVCFLFGLRNKLFLLGLKLKALTQCRTPNAECRTRRV